MSTGEVDLTVVGANLEIRYTGALPDLVLLMADVDDSSNLEARLMSFTGGPTSSMSVALRRDADLRDALAELGAFHRKALGRVDRGLD